MTKVTLTFHVCVLAGGTDLTRINNTKPRVEYASGNWVVALISLVRNYLNNTATKDFIGASDAELNTSNNVGHCSYYNKSYT